MYVWGLFMQAGAVVAEGLVEEAVDVREVGVGFFRAGLLAEFLALCFALAGAIAVADGVQATGHAGAGLPLRDRRHPPLRGVRRCWRSGRSCRTRPSSRPPVNIAPVERPPDWRPELGPPSVSKFAKRAQGFALAASMVLPITEAITPWPEAFSAASAAVALA